MLRQKNTSYRSREHLTIDEVNELIHGAGCRGRHKHRDSTLLLMMFRHGLRVSEACEQRSKGGLMEPTTEQFKAFYSLCVRASNMFQPVNLARLDERTKRIYVLIGDTIQIEIYQNGEVIFP